MPATRFLRNTLLFSLLGLIPTLLIYIITTPSFGAMLISGGLPLGRFLRQIATNGLPVVFVVNYTCFFLYAWACARGQGRVDCRQFLLADLICRLAVFVALHAIIYVISADWFGSFGGSRLTALRVLPPTLARSAMFENLSGVYLYATLISAWPLYAELIGRTEWVGGLQRTGARRIAAYIIALLWIAVSALALTGLAVLVSWL